MSMHNDLKRPRPGRPPSDLVATWRRILDAAQRVFLKRGLSKRKSRRDRRDGAGEQADHLCPFPREGGALRCGCGPCHRRIDGFRGLCAQGRSVQDKLAGLGIEVVESFIDETIGITRATIAEASRQIPALVHGHGRDRAAAAVSHVLNDATHTRSRASTDPSTRNEASPRRRSSWISFCCR